MPARSGRLDQDFLKSCYTSVAHTFFRTVTDKAYQKFGLKNNGFPLYYTVKLRPY